MTKIAFLFLLVAHSTGHALNLTFEKALDAEIDRCASVLPVRDIHEFAMQLELGFLSEDQIKKEFGDDTLNEVTRLVKVVLPFLTSLDERGEIMDLAGKDELTVSCAKYAKGVLITPYQKLVRDMVQSALKNNPIKK